MFSALKTLIGNVTAEEKDGIIHIRGVRADFIEKDLKHYFGSTRVSNNMFDFKRHEFSFPSFFAPDFLFTIDRLIDHRSLKISINTLYKIKHQLLTNTWLKRLNDTPVSRLNKERLNDFYLTPLDFQEEFFDVYDKNLYLYNLKGFLFAAAAGSGKTFSSLALTHCLEPEQVIIVAPKNSLYRVWKANIEEHFKKVPNYWISADEKPFTGNEKYIIVHYEYLSKLLEQLDKIKANKLAIILDESHNLNETSSARTNYFIDLCERTKATDVIWLSGTPIKATALEAIPLIRCIDPLFTKEAEQRFKAIYKGDNTKATEILNNRLGLVSFKVAKDRLKLEPPIFKQINVSFKEAEKYTLDNIKEEMRKFIIERTQYYKERRDGDRELFHRCLEIHETALKSKDQQLAYKQYRHSLASILKYQASYEVKDDIVYCNRYELKNIIPTLPENLRKQFKDVKTIYKYVHLKIQGECLGRVVSRARINCHVDMVKHIDFLSVCESTTKKTVVFTSFTEVIEEANRILKERELNPLMVYAKTTGNLNTIIARFDKDEAINPLVATYASLSTAVPLVMADTMILIDTPFRDYILQQSVSRIHRLGSDTQTYVYTCILDTNGKPNISTRTVDILKWSQEATEQLIGIKSPFELKDDLEDSGLALEQYNLSIEGYQDKLEIVNNHSNINRPSYCNW